MSENIGHVEAMICLENLVHLPAKWLHKAFEVMNQDLSLRGMNKKPGQTYILNDPTNNKSGKTNN